MPPTMLQILRHAWDHPDEPAIFYSANGAETASPRLNAMDRWDWTPEPSVGVPGVSTCMFPLALGCRPKTTSEGKEWVEPCIDSPDAARAFAAPDVRTGRTGEILDNVETLLRDLPPGARIRDPDTQSPLGVAELMWGEDLYMAMVEEPDAVHALLAEVTDFVIAFVRELHRIAGERLNACGFPLVWCDHRGTMVADDSMSLVSPAMHAEFSVPYLARMAEAAGPLYYHSCTWRAAYFDNIKAIPNVRACNWNPGNSDDPAVIFPAFAKRAVLTPHLVLEMHRDNDVLALEKDFADEAAWFEYMLDAAEAAGGCTFFWFSNIVKKGDQIEAIYDLLDARGHTPRARGCA